MLNYNVSVNFSFFELQLNNMTAIELDKYLRKEGNIVIHNK